jgi:2-methylene-furan-3-one reductase
MSIPDVQKAWVSVRKGAPSKSLELKTDWPVSKKLKSGEVLVKIQASALNPV